MTDVQVCLCTVPSAEVGGELARGLVESRLAACVNIVPGVRSVYRWKGEIQDDGELLLIIKTTRQRFEPMRDWLVDAHPYDVPEVIALSVESGADAYLAWVLESIA